VLALKQIHMTTEVLIIGAGPTGLMFANQLQRFGIDFILVDTKSGPTLESRAMSVSSRSMEIYQQLGLSDTVLERSKKVQGITMLRNGKQLAQVNLTDIGDEFCDFARLTTTFEQNKNEQLLYENLLKQQKEVLWKHSFESCQETAEGVITQVKNLENQTITTIHSKYIVGCGGARSPVRKHSKFSFEGGTYDNKFYVADLSIRWDYGYDNVVMVPENGIFVAFFPLQEQNKIRVIGTLPKEFADQEDISFSTIEQKIKEVSKVEFEIAAVNWFSVYRIHHRVVDTFSKGRVFLAGDAAHIHSPAGGQGMNTGLQDAHNLGWKMAFVLKGYAPASLLDTYNQERLPYALSLVNSTDKGFEFISGHTWLTKTLRSYVVLPLFSVAMRYKMPAVQIFKRLSQLFYSYAKGPLALHQSQQKLTFRAGDQLPQRKNGYYNHFKAPTLHLVCIGKEPLSEDKKAQLSQLFPFEINVVEEKLSAQWKQYGVQSDLFILVRPDHHILFVGDTIAPHQVATIREQLGYSSKQKSAVV
jgi:2-polyprenyl-6-methoxyphenol hydroxylase-like FAD-dependent oxidoreductase